MNNYKTTDQFRNFIAKSMVMLCFAMAHLFAAAQEEPPRPMQLSNYQYLNFGAFLNGYSGGTVTVEPGGSRTLTGDLIPVFMGYQFHPAVFEVEANPGVLLSIVNGPDVQLTGSNGGSITLHLGTSLPPSPFINTTHPPYKSQIMLGGTITVGNSLANPPGDYTGVFYITFIQE